MFGLKFYFAVFGPFENGARGRNRTTGTRILNQLRATAFSQRFFACGKTAQPSLPALAPSGPFPF